MFRVRYDQFHEQTFGRERATISQNRRLCRGVVSRLRASLGHWVDTVVRCACNDRFAHRAPKLVEKCYI